MPMAETVLVAVVTPPPQLKVAPVVVDEAVKGTDNVVQVSCAGVAILTLGAGRMVSVPVPGCPPQALLL